MRQQQQQQQSFPFLASTISKGRKKGASPSAAAEKRPSHQGKSLLG